MKVCSFDAFTFWYKNKLNMFQAGTTTITVNQPTAYHALFCSQTVKTRKMDSGFNQKEVSLLCLWFVRTTELLKQGPVREMMHGRHKHTLITENVNIFLLFQMNIIQMVICHHARGYQMEHTWPHPYVVTCFIRVVMVLLTH